MFPRTHKLALIILLTGGSLLVGPSAFTHAQQAAPVALYRETAQSGAVTSVAFSPDSSILAVGGYQTVTLFHAETGKTLAKLSGHAGVVTALAFSPDGRILAAAGGQPGKSGEVRLWDSGVWNGKRT